MKKSFLLPEELSLNKVARYELEIDINENLKIIKSSESIIKWKNC